jgi:hypothetical protein
MALTAATGWIAEQEELLRVLLADSDRWRTWCDADDHAEALEHIYIDEIPLPKGRDNWTAKEHVALMPYALVNLEPFVAAERTTGYARGATLNLKIIDKVDSDIAHDNPEIGRLFKNNYGTVVDEMLTLAHQGGYLVFKELQIAEGWDRTAPELRKSEGDAVAIAIIFSKVPLR